MIHPKIVRRRCNKNSKFTRYLICTIAHFTKLFNSIHPFLSHLLLFILIISNTSTNSCHYCPKIIQFLEGKDILGIPIIRKAGLDQPFLGLTSFASGIVVVLLVCSLFWGSQLKKILDSSTKPEKKELVLMSTKVVWNLHFLLPMVLRLQKYDTHDI